MKKINIAIDGYSSCGKSTLAKQLAKELGYTYVDSGAMYRAVALYALHRGAIKGDDLDRQKLIALLDDIEITFRNSDLGDRRTLLNGEDVEDEIRSMEVSQIVSAISTVQEVRARSVRIQQKLGEENGVVMDGRDIGTVVFPNAELKIFMKADPLVRAQRRYDELLAKGQAVTFEEVVSNLRKRDHQDENREHDPLKVAEDAVLLDNSNLTPEEQFRFALELAREKIR